MKYESKTFRKEKITSGVSTIIALIGYRALLLDRAKREIYYDKMPDAKKIDHIAKTAEEVLNAPEAKVVASLENINPRLLHAILGIITELGEIIHQIVVSGGNIDTVNMKEEFGDISWYFSLACEAMDTTSEEIRAANIAKLDARYGAGQKTGDDRDLTKEREVLEKAVG